MNRGQHRFHVVVLKGDYPMIYLDNSATTPLSPAAEAFSAALTARLKAVV